MPHHYKGPKKSLFMSKYTYFNLCILYKVFQVVFTASSFVGNPVNSNIGKNWFIPDKTLKLTYFKASLGDPVSTKPWANPAPKPMMHVNKIFNFLQDIIQNHTVVGVYINTMKTTFFFKFWLLINFFSNYKFTNKIEKLYLIAFIIYIFVSMIFCIHAV